MAQEIYKKCVENDGVSPDIYTKVDLFLNCPLDSSVFNPDDLPNLLVCGHFICSACLEEDPKPTFCAVCQKPLKIKNPKYKGLIEQNAKLGKTDQKYHFMMFTSNGGGERIQNITSDLTFEQIFTKSNSFINELALSNNENDINLVIRKSHLKYTKIKGIQLKDKIATVGIVDNTSKQPYNRVMIVNRYDGGQ